MLQHVSIIIQIIFREHNVCCVCVRTHTKRYAAASPHLTFYILNIFLNSVTLTRNIRDP